MIRFQRIASQSEQARCDNGRHPIVTHRINKRTYDGRNRMGTCDVMQMEVYADLEK